MNNIKATWNIELLTSCPKCDYGIDITQIEDFWHTQIEPIEYGTVATTDFEVTCPECTHEFKVDFEYYEWSDYQNKKFYAQPK